jgi:hypothetical protein
MTITMLRKLLRSLLIFGLFHNAQTLFSQNTPLDTITTLENPSMKKAVYKAPNGKTTLVTAPVEDFATISDLLKTLAKDGVIRPKLSSTKPRIAEEKRRIRLLQDTYIYAFKKEPDNDYHLIIGDHKSMSKATFFNIELSGLATNSTLSAVREVFEKRFVNACTSSYIIFSQNPIKIQIEGSLFFDFDHNPGEVGPTGFRPATCWELHPLSKLVFL